MKLHSMFSLTALCLTVAACADIAPVSRNAALDIATVTPTDLTVTRNYNVRDVRAFVSPNLLVAEGNSYYPITDIVWRGDSIGDRHQQIAAIFETAAARKAETLRGDIPVVADIQLMRFHGVTERAHYTVGGVYNIIFQMTVRDARTGAVIEPTRVIEADLPAPGGQAAVRLEQIGQTEKVRVTDFLTMVLERELTGTYKPI